MAYDIAKMREKLKNGMGNRQLDPNEFRPPKAQGVDIKYKFFVLPPLAEGDRVADGGTASKLMDIWYTPFGQHWVNKRPHVCPRIVSEGEIECAMCNTGFELFAADKNAPADVRSAIAKQWLPQVQNIVNVYFPPVKTNPEEVQGKVLFMKLPKACFDHFKECLEREDDGGDPDDPQAFGAFFDEESAFMYELVIKRKSDYNNYEASRFIGGSPRPIVAKSDGSPDRKAIDKILNQRHDLWAKSGKGDPAAIQKIVATLVDGDDDDNDSGFDKEPVKESRSTARPATRRPQVEDEDEAPKPARAKARPAVDEDEDEVPKRSAKPARAAVVEDDEDDAPRPSRARPALDEEEEVAKSPTASRPKAQAASPDVDELLSQLNEDDDDDDD